MTSTTSNTKNITPELSRLPSASKLPTGRENSDDESEDDIDEFQDQEFDPNDDSKKTLAGERRSPDMEMNLFPENAIDILRAQAKDKLKKLKMTEIKENAFLSICEKNAKPSSLKGNNNKLGGGFKTLAFLVNQGNNIENWEANYGKMFVWQLEALKPLPYDFTDSAQAQEEAFLQQHYVLHLACPRPNGGRSWMPWLKLVSTEEKDAFQLIAARPFSNGCTIGIVTGKKLWQIDEPFLNQPNDQDLVEISQGAIPIDDCFSVVNKEGFWQIIKTLPLPYPQGMGMHYLQYASNERQANVGIMPDGRVVAEKDIPVDKPLMWVGTMISLNTMLAESIIDQKPAAKRRRASKTLKPK